MYIYILYIYIYIYKYIYIYINFLCVIAWFFQKEIFLKKAVIFRFVQKPSDIYIYNIYNIYIYNIYNIYIKLDNKIY